MSQSFDLYDSYEIKKFHKLYYKENAQYYVEASKGINYIVDINFNGDFKLMYDLILQAGYKTTIKHVRYVLWDYIAAGFLDLTPERCIKRLS